MAATHHYELVVEWTGNDGSGTSGYRAYSRDHDVRADGKASTIAGSADPSFRGDPERWNPEEMLVASLSQCHMLWYLHLAAVSGVVVTGYVDHPTGTMVMDSSGGGRFSQVTLRPRVTVADASMVEKAKTLHAEASAKCFIANSMNFSVHHAPQTQVA